MSDNLPPQWETWRLADTGVWSGGGTPSSSNDAYWDGDVPWVSPKDMKVHRIATSQDKITQSAVVNSAAKLLPIGSVLFVTRSGILAHSLPVATTKVEVTVNQDLKAISPVEVIDTEYLAWALRASERRILNTCTKHGTTVHSVEMPALKELKVPVAPYPEQRRIVAKIEELFSELDKGIESLKLAREQLKIYRLLVLNRAFEGRLTERWREENKAKLIPPTEVAAKIDNDRESSFHHQLAKWAHEVGRWEQSGRHGKKPTKPRKLDTPAKPSTEHELRQWRLPSCWQWLQIGSFSFVTKLAGFEYTKFVRYDDNGDLPVLKAENAGRYGFRATPYSKVRSEAVAELTRSYLHGGELLMVFVGAGTGNVALVPEEQKFFLGPNIGMIRIETDAVSPRYLELFLRSPKGNDMVLAAVKAVAQPSLSMATIRQTPIALPPPSEQEQIVVEVDAALSLIDRAEADIDAQVIRSAALRQAILNKAFSGQLVLHDPADEPASILLARIQAAKVDHKKTGRKSAA